MTKLNIIASKPRDENTRYVVIMRNDKYRPFVSATVSDQSLAHNEWFWGHYFATRAAALNHFNSR